MREARVRTPLGAVCLVAAIDRVFAGDQPSLCMPQWLGPLERCQDRFTDLHRRCSVTIALSH